MSSEGTKTTEARAEAPSVQAAEIKVGPASPDSSTLIGMQISERSMRRLITRPKTPTCRDNGLTTPRIDSVDRNLSGLRDKFGLR